MGNGFEQNPMNWNESSRGGGNGSSAGKDLITYARPARYIDSQMEPPPQIDYSRREDSLAHYWHTLLKRRWTVLTVAFVLTTLAVIGSYKTEPIFLAASRVQVEAETPLIQSLNDLYHGMSETDDAFLQTQLQVVQSDTLAWQTVEQLGLRNNESFVLPSAMAKLEPEAQKVRSISAFKSALSVELIPKTRIMVVGFESPDPRLAATVANALVNNYVDYNFRLKYDATRVASGWMEKQLDELKAKVEKSQQALVDYERRNALANSGGSGTQAKQNVEEQTLSDVSKDLTVAQGERIQKESLYNQVRNDRAQIASLAHNDLLQSLEQKSSELKGLYTEVLAQYGPNFPKAVRLQQQIEENQTQIVREQNRVLERVHVDYVTALNREKLARVAVAEEKTILGHVNQLLVQHNILQRDFEANEQLYQNLIQRLKDATVSAGLRSTNIHQVDMALPPDHPVRPKKLLNIGVGLLAGLMLGIMLVFAQEALDHTVKSMEEVESLLAIPALGMIPILRGSRKRTAYGLLGGNRNNGPESSLHDVALAVAEHPSSVFAEAYRSLRTSILLSLADHPPKTLLVTSAVAGDGKTVTSLNLAMALAQRKGPVLLVDADLRKMGISKILKCDMRKGLSTVLTGGHAADDVLQPYSLMPNLWILPAGPTPPSPADLLLSEKMAALLEKLSERFEQIIIDSPPVMAVTDATILSRLVDGVVIVAQGSRTSKTSLLRTCRTLEAAGARILGFILNKFDFRNEGYYGYSYGAAYGAKEQKAPHKSSTEVA